MVNQTREDEDLSASRYIEDYLDCVENLPDDLQRQLSRMLDLDATCQKFVREFDQHEKVLARGIADTAARRQALVRVQKTLIIMQDIGDEKLQIMQTIQDLIEKKARQLDIDYRNLRPRLEQENNVPLNASNSNSVCSNSKTSIVNNERLVRRARRTRTDPPPPVEPTPPPPATAAATDTSVLSENQSSNLPSTSNGSQKRTSTSNSGKKKKRKSSNNQQNQSQEETPPPNNNDDDDEQDAEPDEPLYCLCNQISFGKMIMCDNDSCALEWFHFSCVSLTAKPKGKWYCPQCRGSRPNIMKPKPQFR